MEAPPAAAVAGDDSIDAGGEGDAVNIPQPVQNAAKICQPQPADGVVAEPGVVDIVEFTGARTAALVNEHK